MVEPAAEKLLGINPLDRGRNLLAILRQPSFIEYFNHIDQAPDGIRLQAQMDEDRYVQVKLTRFGGESRLLVAYDTTRYIILNKCVKTSWTTFLMNYVHHSPY